MEMTGDLEGMQVVRGGSYGSSGDEIPGSLETTHRVFKGVRQRRWGRWVSEIREPRKKSRIWLGSYPSPEMAARAHDVAALCLKGPKASINFPETAHLLPRPASTSPKDIQAAALNAAVNCSGDSAASDRCLRDGGSSGAKATVPSARPQESSTPSSRTKELLPASSQGVQELWGRTEDIWCDMEDVSTSAGLWTGDEDEWWNDVWLWNAALGCSQGSGAIHFCCNS